MTSLLTALAKLGLEIWRSIKAGEDAEKIKREAAEQLIVAIDNAEAKERLRARQAEKRTGRDPS